MGSMLPYIAYMDPMGIEWYIEWILVLNDLQTNKHK